MALNLNAGKTKTQGNAAHAGDQETQSDKPVGPEPKSMATNPQKPGC